MVVLLMITSVAAAQLWMIPVQGARTASPGPGGPASEGRLFDIPSHQAWELVRRRLKDLAFPPDKIDRASQFALTKWRAVCAKGVEWLPAPAVPEHYVAKRVRFVVFVSPFVEPARVYIGSLIEATKMPSVTATAYNVPNVNRALMSEIANVLGQEGLPIPPDREERRQLALSVLKDEADDCLRHGSPPKGTKITPPRKIPLSEFEFLYPAPALEDRKEGVVQVEFTILEDGGVTEIRLLGPKLGRQLEASAMGVASLLFYSPAKLDECRVPSIMKYTVRYRLQR